MAERSEPTIEEIELGERVARELSDIGHRREVRVAGLRLTGRRRRPSGESAPLPRELRASGVFWLVVGIGLVLLWISLFAFVETTNWWTDRDLTVLRWFRDIRSDGLDSLTKAVHALGSEWTVRPLRWAMIAVLLVYKRWRHLFGALGAILMVEVLVDAVALEIGRPRPFVPTIGVWEGYSHPSGPVASLAVTLAVMGYALIPRGSWRTRWFLAGGVAVTGLVVSRVYLGVDHPTDGVVSAFLGVAVAVIVFRLFVPETVFPVSYRGGTTAHLDVGGERGEAIRVAVRHQLGFEVLAIEPFGQAGSGGSTPLRLTVAGDPNEYLFAKLYARSHLRSDRWYKLGRTILYGALEDEVRFTSVRRLVEYEDYLLLTMKKAGLPSAEPFGFVEITPEREYLIVTEFLHDAVELSDAEVDETVIDGALLCIHQLWHAGLAHRDIKPANVMVRHGRVVLVDVAFGTVRPSPWRQAVDLANMMIILALRTDPDTVYERALRFFAPDDIAEAFAATRGITIPSQSRTALHQRRRGDGTDVIARFRELAPPREPIAVQRWGPRRMAVTFGAVLFGLFVLSVFLENISGAGFI